MRGSFCKNGGALSGLLNSQRQAFFAGLANGPTPPEEVVGDRTKPQTPEENVYWKQQNQVVKSILKGVVDDETKATCTKNTKLFSYPSEDETYYPVYSALSSQERGKEWTERIVSTTKSKQRTTPKSTEDETSMEPTNSEECSVLHFPRRRLMTANKHNKLW